MADTSAESLAGSDTKEIEKPDYGTFDDAERQRVQREFASRYKTAKKHWTDWREEARDLYDFIAGRQWDDGDVEKLEQESRPVVTFNISGKYMDAVTGLQINNRQDIRYFPRTNGAVKVNEMMTGTVDWCRDLANMVDEETDAFYDVVLTGLGCMECFLDKDTEPEGVAAGRRVDNLEILPDPTARQRNLEDGKFIIRERMMDHEDYEEIFGEYAEDTGQDPVGVEELNAKIDEDTGLQIIPSPHDYGDSTGDRGERSTGGKCPVQDYQFWCREVRYVVEHPAIGRQELTTQEMTAQKGSIDTLVAAGQPVKVEKIRKKVYYRAWFSKGIMGPYGLSPYQGGFTYHVITGKRDRNKQCWYGLGRAMTDAQRWTNKFFSTILYCLMVGAKGGIMAEENAFKDARKAEDEWSNPNSITWLNPGSLSGDKPRIMPKPVAQYPEGLDRLMEFTLNALPQTLGLNAELLGLADRDQAGVLEAQRKQSAMAIIAWAFDAMRRYYKSMGRQMANYVIQYMPEGIIVKINGPDQAQYVPLVKDQMNAKFDVIVDEAPTSTNMRERVWAVIETLVPQLLQAGLAVPKEVLDYSPLPADLAQKWKEALQPTPEAQQQKALEMQALSADVQLKNAQAKKANADSVKAMADANAPPEQGGGMSDALVKAQSDQRIASMQAAIDAHTEELRSNRKAQTDILIAGLKLKSDVEIAKLQGLIDLKLGQMQSDTAVKVAKSRPKPASKSN